MRALAEVQANGEDPEQLHEDLDGEDLEDEVERQDLDELQLGMEPLDARGDGARVAGEGPPPSAPVPA
jgi:hypothetical protein